MGRLRLAALLALSAGLAGATDLATPAEKVRSSLAEAGLDRVNVSLDTVRADTFHTITRRDRFDDVVAGLAAAQAAAISGVPGWRAAPAASSIGCDPTAPTAP